MFGLFLFYVSLRRCGDYGFVPLENNVVLFTGNHTASLYREISHWYKVSIYNYYPADPRWVSKTRLEVIQWYPKDQDERVGLNEYPELIHMYDSYGIYGNQVLCGDKKDFSERSSPDGYKYTNYRIIRDYLMTCMPSLISKILTMFSAELHLREVFRVSSILVNAGGGPVVLSSMHVYKMRELIDVLQTMNTEIYTTYWNIWWMYERWGDEEGTDDIGDARLANIVEASFGDAKGGYEEHVDRYAKSVYGILGEISASKTPELKELKDALKKSIYNNIHKPLLAKTLDSLRFWIRIPDRN